MRIVLDHCVPARFAATLTVHSVATAASLGWATLRNGALLAAAGAAGFDALLTVDQSMPHEQNLARLPLAVVVLRAPSNDLDDLRRLAPLVLEALERIAPRTLVHVPSAGAQGP